jgi:hypothetical protein
MYSGSLDGSDQVSFGSPNYQFKDLHLSGTVNVGGSTVIDNNRRILAADGAANVPYITFSSDTNTGLYRPSADVLGISTGGSERARIDSSGNLLVGLTSVSGIATGSTADNGIYLDGTNGAVVAQSSANKNLYASKATGFSDPDFISFQVAGSSVGSIGVISTDNLFISGNATNHAGLALSSNVVLPMKESAYADAAVDLGVSSIRFKDIHLSGTSHLTKTIDEATLPSTPANHVITLQPPTTTARYGGGISWSEGSNTAASINTVDAGSGGALHLAFSTGSNSAIAERMRLDTSGNVLVGKTAVSGSTAGIQMKPAGELSVVRDGNHALILNRLSSPGSLALFQQASTTVGSISVTSSATAYNTSSDQRLKDNIVDAPSASDDIDAIQVRSFDWKADGSHQKYGMVAQELQSVAPEAVTGDANSDDMMGVDYSKLVPMMMKEIQLLRARVAQLEGAN